MWMGGPVPLGYDVRDRSLIINEAEAQTVRKIFELYLELGNVREVVEERPGWAAHQAVVTKSGRVMATRASPAVMSTDLGSPSTSATSARGRTPQGAAPADHRQGNVEERSATSRRQHAGQGAQAAECPRAEPARWPHCRRVRPYPDRHACGQGRQAISLLCQPQVRRPRGAQPAPQRLSPPRPRDRAGGRARDCRLPAGQRCQRRSDLDDAPRISEQMIARAAVLADELEAALPGRQREMLEDFLERVRLRPTVSPSS